MLLLSVHVWLAAQLQRNAWSERRRFGHVLWQIWLDGEILSLSARDNLEVTGAVGLAAHVPHKHTPGQDRIGDLQHARPTSGPLDNWCHVNR